MRRGDRDWRREERSYGRDWFGEAGRARASRPRRAGGAWEEEAGPGYGWPEEARRYYGPRPAAGRGGPRRRGRRRRDRRRGAPPDAGRLAGREALPWRRVRARVSPPREVDGYERPSGYGPPPEGPYESYGRGARYEPGPGAGGRGRVPARVGGRSGWPYRAPREPRPPERGLRLPRPGPPAPRGRRG